MTFPKNRFVRLFSIIILILVIIFVFLNIYINLRVKKDLRDALGGLVTPLGYNADFTHVGLDPLFNLRLLNLSFSDQNNSSEPLIHIDDLIIKPQVLSSLLSGKLKIRGIVADKSVIDAQQQDIAKLRKAFNKVNE